LLVVAFDSRKVAHPIERPGYASHMLDRAEQEQAFRQQRSHTLIIALLHCYTAEGKQGIGLGRLIANRAGKRFALFA